MLKLIDSEFARKVVHDLKAPLSALLVLRDSLENQDQKDLIIASIERYEQLIKEIQEAAGE